MLHIRHLCRLDILSRFSGSGPHFTCDELKLVTLVLEEPVEGLGELVAGFENLAPSEDVEPEPCAGKSDSHASDITEISDTLCPYQREDNIYISVSKLGINHPALGAGELTVILLALVFIDGSECSWKSKQGATCATAIQNIPDKCSLPHVCCEDSDLLSRVAQKTHVLVHSDRIFCLPEILNEVGYRFLFPLAFIVLDIDELKFVLKPKRYE